MRCTACTRFNLLAIACIATALALFAANRVPAYAPAASSAASVAAAATGDKTTTNVPAAASSGGAVKPPAGGTVTPSAPSANTVDRPGDKSPVATTATATPAAPNTSTVAKPAASADTASRGATPATSQPVPATVPVGKTAATPAAAATATASTAAATSTAAKASKTKQAKTPPCKPTKTVGGDDTLLRSALKGVKYRNNLVATNGTPPFTFTLSECALPSGLALAEDGRLEGMPTATGEFRFSVTVKDSAMPPMSVSHYYALRVYLPASSGEAGKPSAPPAPQKLTGIPRDEADRLARELRPRMTVYELTEAKIAKLMKPPQPAKDAPAAQGGESGEDGSGKPDDKTGKDAPADKPQDADKSDDAAYRKQLQDILLKLKNVEYPSRDLFEKALDAGVCAQVNALAAAALTQANAKGKKMAPPDIVCPPVRSAVLPIEKRPALEPTKKGDTGDIPLAELPLRILPDEMRERIINNAGEEYFFEGLKQRILWTGGDCGCLNDHLSRQIYGFYPFWRAAGGDPGTKDMPAPQPIDFSLMSRIAYVALPINDTGSLDNTMQLDEKNYSTDFIHVAKRYRTKLDVVLYRNTWQSLLNDEAKVRRLVEQLPRSALELIDRPLTDRASRAQSLLSFIEPAPKIGDGLTLYFDDYDDVDPVKFAAFVDSLMNALIDKMLTRSRRYALNIVIPDRLLNRVPAFTFERLFNYLVKAEKLELVDGRIITNVESAESNSNVDLSYLILLSEPTSDSKKNLRLSTERPAVPVLKGSNRKFFLRNLVPVISYAGANELQFADDLVYFSDNFNGVGLWDLPYNLPAPDPGQQIYAQLSENLVANDKQRTYKLCSFICVNRWWGRLSLIALVLIGIVSLPVRMLVCDGAVQSPRYLYFLRIGGVVFALVAIAMLTCDPELRQLITPLLTPKVLLGAAGALMGLIVWQEKRKRYLQP